MDGSGSQEVILNKGKSAQRFVDKSVTVDKFIQHLRQKRCQCLVCYKEFSTRYCTKRHLLTVHMKPEGIGCSFCGKIFNYPLALRRHYVKYHGEGTVICPNAKCTYTLTDVNR